MNLVLEAKEGSKFKDLKRKFIRCSRNQSINLYVLGYFIMNLISVLDPDPFGSVSFWSAGSGSASMKRIRIWVAKNQPKSWNFFLNQQKIIRISYIFFKTINLMFTDIISRNGSEAPDQDPYQNETDPKHYKRGLKSCRHNLSFVFPYRRFYRVLTDLSSSPSTNML